MGRRRFCRTWVACTQALAFAFLGAANLAAHAVDPPGDTADTSLADVESILQRWQTTASVRASAGYRDNVALSHAAPQPSGFARGAIEVGAIRAPLDGNQLLLLLTAEDTRYFRNVTPDHEDLITGNAEWRHLFRSPWEMSFAVEGVYLDQVLDLSVTETNRVPLPLRGGLLTARPGVRYDFSDNLWMNLEVPINRQYFTKVLDDYSEVGPKVTLTWPYGYKSEMSLGYAFVYRPFDTEEERALDSQPIPGTHRETFQHEAAWIWKHHWDKEQHWLSSTKIGFRILRDGASGYFDFDRVAIAEEIRCRFRRWEARAE